MTNCATVIFTVRKRQIRQKEAIILLEKIVFILINILDKEDLNFFPNENKNDENLKYSILDENRKNVVIKLEPYQSLHNYLDELFSIAMRTTNMINVNVII
jgi:hypothetical protein